MKLLNELYTITRETHEDGAHDYLLRLNAGHFIYAAHFPGEPITPGVCILQIAHELLQLALKKPLKIICVKNVKFMKLVSPDQIREIHYSISKISESVSAEWSEYKAQKHIEGAKTETPPANTGGAQAKSKEEIMKIENTADRQKAIAENHELFGI